MTHQPHPPPSATGVGAGDYFRKSGGVRLTGMPDTVRHGCRGNEHHTRETTMTAQLEAKMDAKLATRTVGQLKEMVRMLWSDKTPEAAIVRGRIWNRLSELIGEDAADEVFEAK